MNNDLHSYDNKVFYDNLNLEGIDMEKITNLSVRLKTNRDVYMILVNSIGQPSNNDTVNKLSVDKLLNEIAELSTNIEDSDLVVLEEQLSDMRTGMCPAGRSLRLVQVLKAWREYPD